MDSQSGTPMSKEGFFGVYMLLTMNPKYKGRTYIGFTVDPDRRIKQHNKGRDAGGACRTSNRGPWEMILIVRGFPTMISALRFEWAWQHPKRSRRLNGIAAKKSSERMFEYNTRLLSEMLNLAPWIRLPLTVQWLKPDIKKPKLPKDPPNHIKIVEGPLNFLKESKPKKNDPQPTTDEDEEALICSTCFENVPWDSRLRCISDKCGAIFHVDCLGLHFRLCEDADDPPVLPNKGKCPVCDFQMFWAHVVKKLRMRLNLIEKEAADSKKRRIVEDSDDELF